ncbi:MAG TPA: hypothetical protein VMC09_13785 [Anaerolineales bacterium]|nr:hypothetical protein [Anaerolineales bacterium]
MADRKDFVWNGPDGWWYQPGLEGELGARVYFWNNFQGKILPLLQNELDDGWKPITEIGPSGFKLRDYEVTKHTFGVMNVVLWFITLGISFIFDLLSGFGAYKVRRYEVVEFRATLTR